MIPGELIVAKTPATFDANVGYWPSRAEAALPDGTKPVTVHNAIR